MYMHVWSRDNKAVMIILSRRLHPWQSLTLERLDPYYWTVGGILRSGKYIFKQRKVMSCQLIARRAASRTGCTLITHTLDLPHQAMHGGRTMLRIFLNRYPHRTMRGGRTMLQVKHIKRPYQAMNGGRTIPHFSVIGWTHQTKHVGRTILHVVLSRIPSISPVRNGTALPWPSTIAQTLRWVR